MWESEKGYLLANASQALSEAECCQELVIYFYQTHFNSWV